MITLVALTLVESLAIKSNTAHAISNIWNFLLFHPKSFKL